MAKLFQDLQRAIEAIYRIDAVADVADFCINREHLLYFVGDKASSQREALLIQETGDDSADVGLYVSEEVQAQAARFLNGEGDWASVAEHVDAFCVVLEGVSHFVYLTFCGSTQDRPVSRMELELQAELDKFLILRLGCPYPDLVERLFVRIQFHHQLEDSERERYGVANQRARRYARWLDREIGHGRAPRALEDARHLYRKPLSFKLDHIGRAA